MIALGYLFIFITALLNVSKGGCSKKVSSKLECMADNINLCFVRNFICVVIGAGILLSGGIGFKMPVAGWLVCVLSGIGMSVNYIVWLMALKGEAYMLGNTASTSSFVIAAVCGVALFGERISFTKLASFLLVVIAMYFMIRYQTKLYKKPSLRDFVLLSMVFVSAGLNSVCQKLFTFYAKGCSVNLFTFYTFAISCLMLAVIRPFFKGNATVGGQAKKLIKLMPFILFMGVALYGATFFQAEATKLVDTVILYPLSSSLSVLGSGIMAWIFFSEKPSKDSIIGAAFVLAALVLSKF